jgi:hypothetical protein
LAQAGCEDCDSIPYLIELIAKAFQEKNWLLLTGAVLMMLVLGLRWLLERAKDRPGLKPYLPWIAVAAGVLASAGAALIAGQSLTTAIVGAVTAGTAAAGLWELVGSRVSLLFSTKKREEKALKKAAVSAYRAGSLRLQPDGSIEISTPDEVN